MKSQLVFAALALLAASPALAQTSATNSNSNSGAMAIVNGDTVYNPSRIRSRVDSTASAIAPGLTAAGVHSCAGSASVGVGVTGFNFGAGATYEMIECNRRAYAATLSGLGQNAAALAMVCNNAEVQNALNQTGVVCPQQRAAQIAAEQQARAVAEQQALYAAQQNSIATTAGRTIPINGGQQLYTTPGTRPAASSNPCQTTAGPACDQWVKANYASLNSGKR